MCCAVFINPGVKFISCSMVQLTGGRCMGVEAETGLIFDSEVCKGCKLCEKVCPNRAILVLRNGRGFVLEVGENCSECGLCTDFCFYGALKIKKNGRTGSEFSRMIKEELYQLGLGKVLIDDSKCILCGLCMANCPNHAVKVDRMVDLHKLRRGEITVHGDRCIECRLCVIYCPTKAVSLRGGKPEIDVEKCIYCEICSKICLKDAIEVRCDSCRLQPQKGEYILGEVKVDEEKCSQCGICSEVCPENAITVTKLLSGKQEVDMEKCFGLDCSICREVCPNMAIEYRYSPEKEIVFNHRCNFCGACETFCPGNAIEIDRRLSELLDELPIPFELSSGQNNRRKEIIIDETCFGCGLCASVCPMIKREETVQIVDGKGKVISTEKCTMCGTCLNNCPVGAISLRELG